VRWTLSASGVSYPGPPKFLLADYLLVFPGGFLPTVSFLVDTMSKGSSGGLIVESISNIGPHYARTLREWRRRFEDKFDDVIVPALQSEHPDVMGPQTGEKGRREIEVFKRKWICA
jgi:cyclopropane-fatty-acyl-phospholipid synthase